MATRNRFGGSITALVTPFKAGRVDEDALRALIDWQIESGTHGFVPVGTTGEGPTLSHEEHRRVVEICIAEVRDRGVVIAGAGSNNTAESLDLARHAEKVGADAVLVVTPYYNKPSQEGHVPALQGDQRCGRHSDHHLQHTTAFRCRHVDRHDAAACTSSRTSPASRMPRPRWRAPLCSAAVLGPEFIQLSGEDMTALGVMAHGGHGCISVTSNVAPRQCADMQEACLAGDFKTALADRRTG